MPYANILVANDGPVRRISINRPDKLNALNNATLTELADAFEAAGSDDSVRVVVLTGEGEKAFVAGADISELQHLGAGDAQKQGGFGHATMGRIEKLGKPVIAAVNGYALGGGLELALTCTLRIASDRALLGVPEIKLGVMPGYGGTQRLARLVGAGRALQMALTGDPVSAQRAYEMGLVNEVVPAEELDATVSKLAAKLATASRGAMRSIIDAVNTGLDMPLDAALKLEAQAFGLLFGTPDMQEGMAAFLEKRPAKFP